MRTFSYCCFVLLSVFCLGASETESWRQPLASWREEVERAPIDATIDPVWHKLPGYNGIRVNTVATESKLSAARKWDQSLVVYDQVPPRVHLEDLPPAPIFRGRPEKNRVALTINVAWGNEYILPILTTLRDARVTATFFLEGNWIRNNPDLARAIVENGHEIGNHSLSHPNMTTLTKRGVIEQIEATNALIATITNEKPRYFAPPSGAWNEATVKTVHELGLYTLLWTCDTIDWQNPTVEKIMWRLERKLDGGGVILMHPTRSSSAALAQMIAFARNKGYEIGTVSQCLDETYQFSTRR
ncbi:MAG: polysaccharide deacetylase family protein [Bacilli bacterium]